jgi:hypothetical protein
MSFVNGGAMREGNSHSAVCHLKFKNLKKFRNKTLML